MASSSRALRSLCAIAAASIGALALPAGVEAQIDDPDVRDVRPIVMLLVDTSGSMERTTDNDLPNCTAGNYERNRWAQVLEALTGSWSDADFTCTEQDRTAAAYAAEFDYRYYIPHFRPPDNTVAQLNDGILDVYVDRVKFGLMTFDPVGTFIGSDPLVPASAWSDAWNIGSQGAYSYGGHRDFQIAGCAEPYRMDNGARNEDSPIGRLVSVGSGDTQADFEAVNRDVQDVLKATRP